MSKGIYEYLEYAGSRLIVDPNIVSFCSLKFSKTLKVYVGQDESDLPPDTDCPMVIITAGARDLSEDFNMKVRQGRVTMAMKWDYKKETNASGVITYPGLAILDEFADLIIKTLSNLPAHPSGYYSSRVTAGPEDVVMFPVFKAFAGLDVQFDSYFQ